MVGGYRGAGGDPDGSHGPNRHMPRKPYLNSINFKQFNHGQTGPPNKPYGHFDPRNPTFLAEVLPSEARQPKPRFRRNYCEASM